MVSQIDDSLASFANATTFALNKSEEDALNKDITDAPEHISKRTDTAHNIPFFISKKEI